MASNDLSVVAKKKTKNFSWTDEVIKNLINCYLNYKIKCDLNNTDFNADKSV